MQILFYVQHHKGIGHVARVRHIVHELRARKVKVTIAFGGFPITGFGFGDADVVQLPPIRAADGGFDTLVSESGAPITDGDKQARCDHLLGLLTRQRWDAIITEGFPLARRNMRFELLPFVKAARSLPVSPLVFGSVRDILQPPGSATKADWYISTARSYFDRLLVHADPSFVRIEETFPDLSALSDMIVYTGLIGPQTAPPATATSAAQPAVRQAPGPPEPVWDVVISVGGGAVGQDILRAAMSAKPLSCLANGRWLALSGPAMPDARFKQLAGHAEAAGVTLERFRSDLHSVMSNSRLSLQMAGYNTVSDLLAAGLPAVLFPYAEAQESEQSLRAQALERLGRACVVPTDLATPQTIAEAIDTALALQPTDLGLRLDGASRTADIVIDLIDTRSQ